MHTHTHTSIYFYQNVLNVSKSFLIMQTLYFICNDKLFHKGIHLPVRNDTLNWFLTNIFH